MIFKYFGYKVRSLRYLWVAIRSPLHNIVYRAYKTTTFDGDGRELCAVENGMAFIVIMPTDNHAVITTRKNHGV